MRAAAIPPLFLPPTPTLPLASARLARRTTINQSMPNKEGNEEGVKTGIKTHSRVVKRIQGVKMSKVMCDLACENMR